MPLLCWSFLRLPVAWIVAVTFLFSLYANCQCFLRGLSPVFQATSPIVSTPWKPCYKGAYQKSELAGHTSLSSKNHESFEKFCYITKYY